MASLRIKLWGKYLREFCTPVHFQVPIRSLLPLFYHIYLSNKSEERSHGSSVGIATGYGLIDGGAGVRVSNG
jgi:hypothetical protein